MDKFEDKLVAIARILALRDFSRLNKLEDLTEEEINLLNVKLNVRFSHSSSGHKCFFSSKIGKAGISENKVKAFTFMLDQFQFKPDLNKNIMEQLESAFREFAN